MGDKFCNNVKDPFLNKLIQNINARFADSDILTAFNIFNPAKMMTAESSDYGEESIRLLLKRFGGFSEESGVCKMETI